MKRCSKCKQLLDVSEFHRSPREKDGLRCWCKSCRKIEKANRDKNKDKQYYQLNRESLLKKTRERRRDDKGYLEQTRQWRQRVKEKHGMTYEAQRAKTNINFRLASYLRSRLYKALKRGTKTGSAVDDLGCSISELKSHLESLFQPGMSWENYGKWHIDHIKPLSSFDLSDSEQLKVACHYSNLQPLWAIDNLQKSDR